MWKIIEALNLNGNVRNQRNKLQRRKLVNGFCVALESFHQIVLLGKITRLNY